MDNPILVTIAVCCIVFVLTTIHLGRVYNKSSQAILDIIEDITTSIKLDLDIIAKDKEITGDDLIQVVFKHKYILRSVDFSYGITMDGDRMWYVFVTINQHCRMTSDSIKRK